MTHVITSLCLRDNGCQDVCPVECINAGTPVEQWPTYYIDPQTCIDCGACIPECPYAAIFHQDDVPGTYQAKGDELVNQAGLTGHYEASNHHGESIILETTRPLAPGETIDLREAIQLNQKFYN